MSVTGGRSDGGVALFVWKVRISNRTVSLIRIILVTSTLIVSGLT